MIRTVILATLCFYQISAFAQKDTLKWIVPTGHTRAINMLTVSPDNKYLLSGGLSSEVVLWEISSGKPLLDFVSSKTIGNSAGIFSKDGKQIITGGMSPSGLGVIALVWDMETNKVIREIRSEKAYARLLDLSDDGKLLATSGVNGLIQIWDVGTGKMKSSIQAELGVNSVQLSANAKQLLVAESGGKIYDVATGELTLETEDRESASSSNLAAYIPGERHFVVSQDNSLTLWNAGNAQFIRKFTGHTRGITSIACSPDGKQVATGSKDGTMKVWDITSGKMLLNISTGIPLDDAYKEISKNFEGTGGEVGAVCYSPDGKYIFAGWGDRSIHMYDAGTGKEEKTLKAPNAVVKYVFISPDKKKLYLRYLGSKRVKMMDIASGKISEPVLDEEPAFETYMKTPDGKYLLYVANQQGMNVLTAGSEINQGKLYLLGDNDWVFYAANKTFDASPGAFDYIFSLDGLKPVKMDRNSILFKPGMFKKFFQ